MADVNHWQLFGHDLRSLPRLWRQGWEEALGWPAFAWFAPQEAVRVVLPDGSEVRRLGATADSAPAGAQATTTAVVLPESSVLIRELILPRLPRAELDQALALEVATVSPFPAEQVVWGWRAGIEGDRLRVRLALAARSHVAAVLERLGDRADGTRTEVWADGDAPIVINGYGEGVRAARLARARGRILVLLATTAVLALALAVTPVLQARERLELAQARYDLLQAETEPLVASRNALALDNERVRAVRTHLEERPDVLKLIETLTAALPDDAYLNRLEIQGRQVRIGGQAGNASQLMDVLGTQHAEFREVRAPAPISRAPGADKENFVIEFVLASGEVAP